MPKLPAQPTRPIVWRLTVLMVLALVMLTAADIATTLLALSNGASELNTYISDGAGGINIGVMVVLNIVVLTPLAIGYFVAMRLAEQVPPRVLDRWWRHIFDIFTVAPRSATGRARSPLRLATAAMVMVVMKALIVGSNVLVALRMNNPTSLAAGLFEGFGLSGATLWQAAYVVLIVPCYVAAVGLGAITLSAVQRDQRAKAAR